MTDLYTDHRASNSPEQFGEDECFSASWKPLGRRSRVNRHRITGKTYTVQTSALPFKDKCIWSQLATFICTSDKFHYCWRFCSNPTPRMRTVSSLQLKGSGRWTPPLQAPNRRPLHLPKSTLAPATCSYFATPFFTAAMSEQRDTNTVISWAKAKTLALTRPTAGTLIRAGFAFSSLRLRSSGSKART